MPKKSKCSKFKGVARQFLSVHQPVNADEVSSSSGVSVDSNTDRDRPGPFASKRKLDTNAVWKRLFF